MGFNFIFCYYHLRQEVQMERQWIREHLEREEGSNDSVSSGYLITVIVGNEVFFSMSGYAKSLLLMLFQIACKL